MTTHVLSANPTHSRWNRSLPPRLRIASGDTVHMECDDSSGAQVHPAMTLSDYLAIDRNRIHALTGPIYVEGAEPGDVLQVDVVEVAHKGWGWTSGVSGLGFLKQRFAEPFFFIWKLEGEVSKSIAPACSVRNRIFFQVRPPSFERYTPRSALGPHGSPNAAT